MTTRFFGAPVQRVEDPTLLKGEGRFTDDIKLPGTLHAAFVRSPFAHARINGIDLEAARAMPGVKAVLAAADLPDVVQGKRILLQVPNPAITEPITQMPLARDEVCFVGEPVAVVLAESRHLAEDAAEMVIVDFEPLPVAADLASAVEPDAATAHAHRSDNIAARIQVGYGDVAAAFQAAAHVVTARIPQHRGTGNPIECRAVLADFNAVHGTLTVWSATQAPHGLKRALGDMLEMADTDLRVIAPDVGGGFGPKLQVYPEEIVVAIASRMLGVPVKWIEDRREHLLTTVQERDQLWTMRMALDAEGKILGISGQMLHDQGAYLPWGVISPYISSVTLPGPYILPAYKLETLVVFTNKVPTTPLRGAGRPQAVFTMERLLDHAADELGLDRAEIRRRNLIPTERMPYAVGLTFRDGKPVVYDSGDYPKCQALAIEKAGWTIFRERQRAAWQQGRYIGQGIANYVEGTGLGPFEGATTQVLPSGRILLRTGSAAQGQGNKTVYAQIAADTFNVDISQVDVEVGDTASIPIGVGAFASRLMVNVGSSISVSSAAVAKKIKQIAAARFEVAEDEIELANGMARVAASQGGSMSFAEIARMTSGMPGFSLPQGIEPGLVSTHYYAPPQATYANGCHVAEVEVDPETGLVKILRYVVVHDCGRMVNPLLVEGQVQGGVAHGIGNALLEKMRFDEQANPVTTSLADYLLPDADNVPEAEIYHVESPSPLNPLGVKGAGEGGTIPAAAAIVSAIEDALRPFGVRIDEAPILPERLCALIDDAAARQAKKEMA
ncbi:xanthine dehydrogenase family protein molybdopterin-binding subunit [Rhodoligotrophos defluvii]|uniref:xanthine dehydrogenase family protein molybdopterin-binding subunit n=1 Tax=Rhodoligotrophos defluvii TaxID=2561934 RepID=UPI0010C9A861|nr:xanthine dehydrogenase family protein molybdopterin-binding subunit [Rhodoligotrophos defluvii]